MTTSDQTKTSSSCPRPGLCLDLLGRLESTVRDVDRHEGEIKLLRESCAIVKQDVHTLVTQANDRDRLSHTLIGLFGAILVAGLAQFGTTVWWGSRLQTTTERLVIDVRDMDAQIGQHSQYINGKIGQ